MLSCKEVTDKLSADIDGELSLLSRMSVRVHQFICSDCKNAASNMRALVASMQDRPPSSYSGGEPEDPGYVDAVDDEYVDRIMAALDSEKNP